MFSITKILCLGAIGNFFMVNMIYPQSRISEIHGNSTGMTSSVHCGNIHPCLSGLDSCLHYGICLLPAPFGKWELSRLALCGDILRSNVMNTHVKTEMIRIDHLSILQCDVSTAWNMHDVPFKPGISLKSEFISFDDGMLHCTDLTMGIGAIMNIHEKARAGLLIQYPLANPNSEFMAVRTNSLFTIGFGFTPIASLNMDIDYVITRYSSGLRPMISLQIDNMMRTNVGYSLPHSSGTFGLSMLVDDIFVQTDIFKHLQLGLSWQISIRYCPDDTL